MISTIDAYCSALKRALARAHSATARALTSRDKWRARAIEAGAENALDSARSETSDDKTPEVFLADRLREDRDDWRDRTKQAQSENEKLQATNSALRDELQKRGVEVAAAAFHEMQTERDGLVIERDEARLERDRARAALDCSEFDLLKTADVYRRESETLKGVRFELDRAVRLGTRPPSAMMDDFKRIMALIPGESP